MVRSNNTINDSGHNFKSFAGKDKKSGQSVLSNDRTDGVHCQMTESRLQTSGCKDKKLVKKMSKVYFMTQSVRKAKKWVWSSVLWWQSRPETFTCKGKKLVITDTQSKIIQSWLGQKMYFSNS